MIISGYMNGSVFRLSQKNWKVLLKKDNCQEYVLYNSSFRSRPAMRLVFSSFNILHQNVIVEQSGIVYLRKNTFDLNKSFSMI